MLNEISSRLHSGPLIRRRLSGIRNADRQIIETHETGNYGKSMNISQSPDIQTVQAYWNTRPCNIRHSSRPIGTKEYFDEVEKRKYFVEPHIPSFAQFDKWKGKKVLEVGCGIGTDTINFARAGASVTAVDLSDESLSLARQRAKVFGFDHQIKFYQGNAEELGTVVPVEVSTWYILLGSYTIPRTLQTPSLSYGIYDSFVRVSADVIREEFLEEHHD